MKQEERLTEIPKDSRIGGGHIDKSGKNITVDSGKTNTKQETATKK